MVTLRQFEAILVSTLVLVLGCPAGQYLSGSTCTDCDQGTFKAGYGDDYTLCLSCTTEVGAGTNTVSTGATVSTECCEYRQGRGNREGGDGDSRGRSRD